MKSTLESPAFWRTAPFLLFLVLTYGQGQFGEASRYWIYLLKTLAGVGLIWHIHPHVPEMRWRVSWEACLAGLVVFGIWVGLEGLYPTVSEVVERWICPAMNSVGLERWCPQAGAAPAPWNPSHVFGANSMAAWLFVVVRIAGSALVVPPLEEVFYRSFLYRYLIKADFESVPLAVFRPAAFVIAALVFGVAHREWLAGVFCALVYQGLVCHKQRLGDAMTAHAVTNFLLGLWVVAKGAWHFWG